MRKRRAGDELDYFNLQSIISIDKLLDFRILQLKSTLDLLNKYKSLKYLPSLEEQKSVDYEYVHYTNKLEGNKLTLVQTTELLKSDTISGTHIRASDILEQKGMYKALTRMKKAILDNEELTLSLIKELNGAILSSLWKDDAQYFTEKRDGQKLGEFKKAQNAIVISKGGKIIKRMEPRSNPENVSDNMEKLINYVNSSNEEVFNKSVKLAQEIWLHQPFRDGNKRLGRLLINFLTMKEGYPLFTYKEHKGTNYNNLLIGEYLDNESGLLLSYIHERMEDTIKEILEGDNSVEPSRKDKNFGMGLLFV